MIDVLAEAGNIDTSSASSTPYVIRYTGQDALGNAAVPAVRLVSVYNQCAPESYCPGTGELSAHSSTYMQ